MQTGEQVDWWESAECAPYEQWVTAYPDGVTGGKAFDESLLNDPLFWRCNYSYELDAVTELRPIAQQAMTESTELRTELDEAQVLYDQANMTLGVMILVALAVAVLAWRLAHQRRVKGFQAYHMDRLAMTSHTYDRDAVAKIRASIDRELEESKKPFPYMLGIRDQYKISLADCAATADVVQESVKEYLRPHEQVRLDEQRLNLELRRRGEMIAQDLQAEIPRFVREQMRRQHQHEQARWVSAKSEVTEMRKTLVATVMELRENPALQSKLGMVIDAMNNLSSTMNNLKADGTLQDDTVGEYIDHLITRVTEDHIAKSTGTSFNAN